MRLVVISRKRLVDGKSVQHAEALPVRVAQLVWRPVHTSAYATGGRQFTVSSYAAVSLLPPGSIRVASCCKVNHGSVGADCGGTFHNVTHVIVVTTRAREAHFRVRLVRLGPHLLGAATGHPQGHHKAARGRDHRDVTVHGGRVEASRGTEARAFVDTTTLLFAEASGPHHRAGGGVEGVEMAAHTLCHLDATVPSTLRGPIFENALYFYWPLGATDQHDITAGEGRVHRLSAERRERVDVCDFVVPGARACKGK